MQNNCEVRFFFIIVMARKKDLTNVPPQQLPAEQRQGNYKRVAVDYEQNGSKRKLRLGLEWEV
jgi:hypothetical protein